jgi:succinate dehydrogenase / fumarate reductase iron-sulfur subunit
MADIARFKILRTTPAAGTAPTSRWDTFEVPYKAGMTVLDALFHIQGYLDPSLAFRSSCRAAVCGSCGMHIGGRYRLACETQASLAIPGPLAVRPMAHLPIIKDLVVDMDPFWARFKKVIPYLVAGSQPPEKERAQSQSERAKLDTIIDCILCSCCYSSCPMTQTDEEYLGPAAMVAANRFLIDSRDDAVDQRLQIVSDEHGIWRCHTVFNCSLVCPKEIDPAGSIANLKRMAVKHHLMKGPAK